MFQKRLQKPAALVQLEALHRRLPPHHPAYAAIQEEYHSAAAGYYGEKSLTRVLERFAGKAHIFQNIRLPVRHEHTQIDALLLLPDAAIIIEVKHWRGELQLSSLYGPVHRRYDGHDEHFPSPLLQVEDQAAQFAEWRAGHGLADIPIHTLIVFSHRESFLHPLPEHTDARNRIITRNALSRELRSLTAGSTNFAYDIARLLHHLHADDYPAAANYTAFHNISRNDITPGVQCPDCQKQGMQRVRESWQCAQCGLRKKSAHAAALADYKAIFGHHITNREARDFLQISSRHTCRRLLQPLAQSPPPRDKRGMYLFKT
ncbi:nuclease-like protein [Salsuginibacillus halophilus]|uniref:Nuclease-like protein n=1 Tax=Salsuginibacillus halophilus TaxID=517424 RepID=A0A2P8HQT2_9BACI|nr:nuclease-related domain-containing protein [Salsuginibacillus halophilus]PSL48583.1 nuclease-like protein [Salsuginibacillus halophilus]